LRENAYLRDRIARFASVATLSQQAFAANYVTSGTIQFLFISPSQSQENEQQMEAPP
jgi:hypothetical protein